MGAKQPMSQTSRKSNTKTFGDTKSSQPSQIDIIDIVNAQLATQNQASEETYAAVAAHRDSLIAGMTAKQRAHARLAFCMLDRKLNPVR
jgi:hypothetical protein